MTRLAALLALALTAPAMGQTAGTLSGDGSMAGWSVQLSANQIQYDGPNPPLAGSTGTIVVGHWTGAPTETAGGDRLTFLSGNVTPICLLNGLGVLTCNLDPTDTEVAGNHSKQPQN